MIPLPHSSFTVTVEAGPGTAHLHIAGALDYDTSDELAQRADQCLTSHADLRELHLDCAELTLCDSMGISTFLAIRRKTTARDIRLHLDNAPPFLERVLTTTGVRTLFTQAHDSQRHEEPLAGPSTSPFSPRPHSAPAPDSSA
ncbi:STAS domain-containing protein [Streptomyces laculatispora]|uniref:STAS domain-containing protein n=1 Tax=Streptomyces laculatispora TaxID=887464 RepID=UPI001F5F70EB|nr:STAS domain-containing protein [Streptomyces laculatispora]